MRHTDRRSVGSSPGKIDSSLDWPMMWAFLIFYLGMMTINVPCVNPGLLEELEGCIEYAGRVRYRLIPGVW